MTTTTNELEISMGRNPIDRPSVACGYRRKRQRISPPSAQALAAAGDADALRQAHRNRVSLTSPDWFGRTPLHLASLFDNPSTNECVGVLLNRGANPDARDRSGRTPEDWARESGNEGALRIYGLWRAMTPERRASLRAQAGFTLIEIIIGLAAFAIVAAGVYTLFFAGSNGAALVKAQSDTAALSTALMSAYVMRANFSGLTTQSAVAEGWIPDELKDASGLPVNAWSQPIALSAVDLDVPGDAKGARIEQDVPAPDACIRLVTGVAGGFDSVSVNGHQLARSDAQNPSALASPCADTGEMAHIVVVRRRM
jgi:prepilin-type N-terminal cleavage/methylation domain-containing protein